MKIGFAQIESSSKFEDNLEQCLEFMLLAGKLDLKLLCFPEMHLSDFFLHRMDNHYPFQHAEGIPGPTVERFQKSAKQLGVAVILNYMEIFNYEFFSSAPVLDNTGKILGVSRMIHVPQIRGYYAQNYFTPSCGDFHVFNTQHCRVGVLISHDRHFPEATRSLALHDADIVLIPGYLHSGQDIGMYEAELKTIAYQNCLYIGMCNRVGVEHSVEYIGQSILVGPDGKTIVKGSNKNELVVAEIDPAYVRQKKKSSPYFALRRPDEYFNIIKNV